MSPGVKIENDQIRNVLLQDVLKREVVEGDKAEEARKRINRAMAKAQKDKAATSNGDADAELVELPTGPST
jgi:hypothetical protein